MQLQSNIQIRCGNNLDVLKEHPDNYFHSVVTDPPYGLKFMGKKWDYQVPGVELWEEAYRVLRPGGYMLVACGTRTQHRMVINIEDAGFEIRDVITWHYGSGFPKSLNVSKAIDQLMGAEREVVGTSKNKSGISDKNICGEQTREADHAWANGKSVASHYDITIPSTDEAKQYNGYGTALKPATEFWTLCRKPLEGTVAQNTLKWGTGLNIDGCRIEFESDEDFESATFGIGTNIKGGNFAGGNHSLDMDRLNVEANPQGRWPANVIFDEFTAEILDEQSGELQKSKGAYNRKHGNNQFFDSMNNELKTDTPNGIIDSGGASRFFYCAKASRSERNKGLENLQAKHVRRDDGQPYGMNTSEFRPDGSKRNEVLPKQNYHPTVKPVSLMRYLVRLVTPAAGICLDPFAGSCTTGIGLKLEGLSGVLIEQYPDFCNIGEHRIAAWEPEPPEAKLSKQPEAENPAQYKMEFPD